MPLQCLIANYPDLFLNHIVSDHLTDSFIRFHLLLRLNSTTHHLLTRHPGCSAPWLRAARIATQEEGLRLSAAEDFRSQIRRILFPWETIPRTLHVGMSTDRWWLSDNGDKIVFAIGDRAEAYPSRPCAPEEVVATTRDVAPAYEPQRPYQPVGFVFPSFDRCDHVHQPLHATAFAVLERFHDNAVERECSGAYFFVVGRNGRASFRMHVCGPDFIGIAQCRARAGEMWIEAEERFLYFGPSAHLSCLQCAVARSRYEPLFWEIMIGAATTVPPLGLRSSIGQRVPLHYAAYSEHIDQVRRILEAEADPNVQDAFGITPLEVAVGLNWVEAIQLLVGFGATGIAPMLHSVSQDDADSWNTTDETVEALLLLKADPNFPNARGQTPLFFSRFDADAVLLLCRAGADPSHADETGTTPLHLSVRRRRLGTVGHLLRHRADVNARTRRGVSPLMLAAGWEQGAELLRENGA